jgi:hypothetical protein
VLLQPRYGESRTCEESGGTYVARGGVPGAPSAPPLPGPSSGGALEGAAAVPSSQACNDVRFEAPFVSGTTIFVDAEEAN